VPGPGKVVGKPDAKKTYSAFGENYSGRSTFRSDVVAARSTFSMCGFR
jgi:hypothetical protein